MSDEEVPWRPLSRRADPSFEETLYEGIPPHLAPSIDAWLPRALETLGAADTLRRLERELRVDQPWPDIGVLRLVIASDPEVGLDVIDLLCRMLADRANARPAREQNAAVAPVLALIAMLDEAGSAWRVGEWGGHFGLMRRVEATITERARAEVEAGRPAAPHLAAAWHHLYGRHPDHDQALDEAVKALEAAARPVLCPADERFTLGKGIAALRAKPEKWSTALGTVEQLADRLDAVWTIQPRHGTDDVEVERHVDAAAAEAAVHEALTLVHWFRSGAVRNVS